MAAVLVLSPHAIRAEPEPVTALVAAARQALLRNDGIDAEMKLREALERGVPRSRVAAFMGGAYLRQGDRARARQWLGPAAFSPDTAAEGFRVLAQLEQQDGNLAAADRAYAKARLITPRDPDLWVEIGRLRYRQGRHLQAIETADGAIRLNPRNVRALEFRGQLIRDRFGLLAALPWFETALMHSPRDVSVLSNYAATLGEMGRAEEMLVVTRRILQVVPGNPQAYYMQAVLAARAGRYDLARSLMARTRGKLDDLAGAMLLDAALQFSAGNLRIAGERCEQFLKLQPGNMHAREILARALYLSGQHRYLTLRFRGDIARGDASPYLLSVVARGYEGLGEREQAGALLDRAASPEKANLRVLPQGSAAGDLMAQGRSADALAKAEQDRAAQPGSYLAEGIAGDVHLALGHAAAAQERYIAAARVRMSDSLLQRRFEAYRLAGDLRGASAMVHSRLMQHPGNRTALRLLATLAVQIGDPRRAAAILDYLRRSGGQDDVQLLTDLALAQLGSGSPELTQRAASQAYRLQRANPSATQALALAYMRRGVNRSAASALLDKARQMQGDNPLLAGARARLRSEGSDGPALRE